MVAVGLGLLAVVVLVGGALAWITTRDDSVPTREAAEIAAAWERYEEEGLSSLVSAAGAEHLVAFKSSANVTRSEVRVRRVRHSGDEAIATFDATHVIAGLGPWRASSRLRLEKADGGWRAVWAPTAVYDELAAGDTFEVDRTWPERGRILGEGDRPLTTIGDVVSVGVQPSRMTDAAAVSSALQQHVGVDPTRVDAAVNAPGVQPDHFVPIISLREEPYQQVRPALLPVPGVVFRRVPARITPAEGFAQHVIGRTGGVTAEQLEDLGDGYVATDTVGRSGLEAAFESTLAGRPSGELRLVRASGERVVLQRFEGAPAGDVRTTLREDVQRAADDALAGVAVPAAVVAVDAGTGAVVASSSRPLDEPLNRALSGEYPPGSTFKIVTAEALLASGAPDRIPCPQETTVDGKRFKNFDGEALGDTTLRLAFAHSCNTVFAPAAAALGADALKDAAARFGFGVEYQVVSRRGIGGEFPDPRDDAETAAAGIGQGRVLATPLHMASVVAAAATGTWRRAPYLIRDAEEARPTATLSPSAVAPLQDFMNAVVREGTARAAAATVPGLIGKTGTAEFGTESPPPTHAWFVGHRNGIAFAVLLEGGGVGGRDAAPIAARFSSALP